MGDFIIKRRSASRIPWPRILERRFTTQSVNQLDYRGYVTLLCLDRVREPLWVTHQGRQLCIVDDGYTWLQQFPTGTQYTVTTQFDADGQVAQWYIDICLQHGVDASGIPWWDDLFLDVVIFPNGECQIIDGEELDAALQSGVIDDSQHRLAWTEATKLVRTIEQNDFLLFALIIRQRTELLAALGR